MRKLFNEFFYIPKHGKMREKVMIARLASTITLVTICLAAMSITAYAYFSYNVTSGFNTIRSATFKTEVHVQITDEAGNAVQTAKPITTNYKRYKIADLNVGKWYTVTIKPKQTDNSAKTGFIIVTAAGCAETYHTQQLGADENVPGGETPEIAFQLMITDSTDVVFEAHWGTSSYYPSFKNKDDAFYITQGEKIKFVVNNFNEPAVEKNDAFSDKTTTVAGAPDTTPSGDTTPPATETNPTLTETTKPMATVTTPPASTEMSETADATEPAANETTTPFEQTEPQTTTENQAAEEILDTATTEESE